MKQKDFVEGKWYKSSKWCNVNDFCKGLSFDGERISFNQIILIGIYDKREGSWYCGDDLELATPEEYSKYLPDGHPDKVIEITVGAWYKSKKWSQYNSYCKATKVDMESGSLFFSEKIMSGEYSMGGGSWGLPEYAELANPEEYSEFLPDGHPDKVNNRFSKYKVGDYVVVSHRRNDLKITMLIKEKTATSFIGPCLGISSYKYNHPEEILRLTDDINIREAFQDEINILNEYIGIKNSSVNPMVIKDEYYVITYLRTGNNYLTKWSGTNESGPRIEIEDKYFASHGGSWGDMSPKTHLICHANEKQIKWLDACIKANKYIPLEEAVKYNITCLPKGQYFHITTDVSKRIVLGTGTAKCGSFICYESTPDSRKYYSDGKYSNWVDVPNEIDIREATPDEIRWLDACIKVNRFIEKTNVPRILPKIGDWVITGGYSERYDGKPLRINKIKDGGYCFFDNPISEGDNFGLQHIVRFCTAEEVLPKCSTPKATLVDTNLIPSDKKMPELYRVYTTPIVKDVKEFSEPISLNVIGTKLIPVKLVPERKKPELPKIIKINLLNTKKVVSLHS